jgi:hypothetical protein
LLLLLLLSTACSVITTVIIAIPVRERNALAPLPLSQQEEKYHVAHLVK